MLGALTEREQKILKLRFGLEDGKSHTLEEVGQEFSASPASASARSKPKPWPNCASTKTVISRPNTILYWPTRAW
jgi:hypothetical protein